MTGGAHLAGDGQHRDAVELGVGDGGDQVGGPGPAGGHADADLAGGAGVALGGEPAALLVPRQDHADLVAEPGQGLVQRHARPARIGKNRIHAVVDQRLHDDIGPAHQFLASRAAGNPGRFGRIDGHVGNLSVFLASDGRSINH